MATPSDQEVGRGAVRAQPDGKRRGIPGIGLLKGLGVTLKTLLRPGATQQYPEVKREPPPPLEEGAEPLPVPEEVPIATGGGEPVASRPPSAAETSRPGAQPPAAAAPAVAAEGTSPAGAPTAAAATAPAETATAATPAA